MIDWVKQNGTEIKTNDNQATIEKAVSLGWKPKQEKEQEQKKPAKIKR